MKTVDDVDFGPSLFQLQGEVVADETRSPDEESSLSLEGPGIEHYADVLEKKQSKSLKLKAIV